MSVVSRRVPENRRGRTSRRSRAFVLWSLAGCLGVQLLATLAITRWPILRDPAHYAKASHLQKRRQETPTAQQVVFFGSSRTQWGIQVPPLEAALAAKLGRPVAVHNWGTAGMTLPYFLLVWDRLERDGARPDLVILEIFPAALLNPAPNGNLQKHQFPAESLDGADLALLERDFELWEGTKQEYWLAALNPLYGRRLMILNGAGALDFVPKAHLIDQTLGTGYRAQGVRAKADAKSRSVYMDRRRNIYAPLTRLPLASTSGVQALEKLVTRLTQAGVPVALLLTPEGPDFRSMYPPGRREELLGYLQGLASNHQITLLNAWEWHDSEDPFLDSHHLFADAADEYSVRLGNELLAPLLEQLASRPDKGPAKGD